MKPKNQEKQDTNSLIPVVLSGGSGTRLWPLSRAKLPKQFCNIFDHSLQYMTIKRLEKFGVPWVVTGQALRDLTLSNLRSLNLPQEQVLFEPMAQNTAAAIAWLCLTLERKGQANEVVGVFSADQLIERESDFFEALSTAVREAKLGNIVTLGISPSFPATGFGYIETATLNELSGAVAKVKSFQEKPSFEKAEQFLKAGNFYWNAGIFVFKVSSMIKALEHYQPNLWQTLAELKPDLTNLTSVYSKLESISIDYAVMEKLGSELTPCEGVSLRCVPCDIGWNDVGSWDAVSELDPRKSLTSDRLVQVGGGDNYVYPLSLTDESSQKVYSFVGVEDLLVVDTPDALLVAKKGSSQRVKEVVDRLKAKGSSVVDNHSFEERPWGKFEVLRDAKNFKSKVIQVLPLQQLSYQSHAKREEIWVITSGEGEVVLNDEVIKVKSGSSVRIPIQAKHRMRNTSNSQPLEFVEVQMGTYFGEDDIVRYQDDYKRTT